ncbi:MAG TPA: hypothetical protein VGC56_07275 [Allosphingosinicella sp.]|jgi:hypothetical protein
MQAQDGLPLVHATAVFTAGEILKAGKLETSRCDTFARQMLYFFALLPLYRSPRGADKSHQLNRFPAVFVLRPEAADPPFHVYPFDTGAAARGFFADQADPLVPLEDYELEPTLSAASRHVEWAFGTREAYFDGRLRGDILKDVPLHEGVTRGYVDVARMGRAGSNQHDKRASAVEVAVDHDIDLQGNVLLAILPKQFLEDQAGPNGRVMRRLADLGIPFETYDWQPNTTPDQFQDVIATIAREWFRGRGWL